VTASIELYRMLYRIRRFEETVLENFPRGVFAGTTHTYLGQEANAVGVISQLAEDDIIFSSHRCHGHFLAYGGDPRQLFAELMGKATGVCAGRGGSQHLHWRNFYSNGIQGGILPLAAGTALAEKLKGTSALTVVFLGDGTLGEGVVFETLNLAALWQVPLLFVVENNRIAQTTPLELALSGSMLERFTAFGIPVVELDTSDLDPILPAAHQSIQQVRSNCSPSALILHTARFGPHSKGDDTRPPELVRSLRLTRDPLTIYAAHLSPSQIQAAAALVEADIDTAFQQALQDPLPQPEPA